MNSLTLFASLPFIEALKAFFTELQVPIDYLAAEPARPQDILGDKYKPLNEIHKLIADVYALGMVNDAIFEGTKILMKLQNLIPITMAY